MLLGFTKCLNVHKPTWNDIAMRDKVLNIIILAKQRNLLHKKKLICRFLRMKYHLKITPKEIDYRIQFLKDTSVFESL